jgi:CheY-like chemotaxis protein
VFDRFRQADGTTTRSDAGLGLGLAIVKHLVELHGGRILAQSAGLGRGATFVVELPITVASTGVNRPSLEPAAPTMVSDKALAGMRILAVDDEPDSRDVLKMLLTMRGAEVVACGDVDTALAAIELERFDMILSDIGMPEKDGYELIRAVRGRTDDQGGRTPAIAITAFARAEDRTRILRAGFHGHVPKPIDIEELVAVIGSLVRR